MERSTAVCVLADALYEGFVKDDNGRELSRTGNLFSACNLRVQKTRNGFAVVRSALENLEDRRVWTKALLRKAVTKMMKDRNLEIPMTSGFSWGQWLKDQVSRLHILSQRARKNAWRSYMDNLQTMPYEVQDWLDRFLNFVLRQHILKLNKMYL